MMLWKLLSTLPEEQWHARVISLRGAGTIGPRIEKLGIHVSAVGFGRGIRSVGAPSRLRREVAAASPDLLQGWMYHGNLAALLARPRSHPPVIWNIRQSLTDLTHERLVTALVIRAGAHLSRRVSKIIYNSHASARQHEAFGFDPGRTVVIPNGFDLSQFKPLPEARNILRARLGVASETILVGQVARFHRMKNHFGFLRAAAIVAAAAPGTAFVLAGKGVDSGNRELMQTVASLGLHGRVHLLGSVDDVPTLMAGLDVLCSPSTWGEGFPNVLGEALASGVPCVTTDVGDSSLIIGAAGIVVPPGDEAALAAALVELTSAPPEVRGAMGREGRNRVTQKFTIRAIGGQYADLYEAVLAERGGRRQRTSVEQSRNSG